jgi:hypothetical protein
MAEQNTQNSQTMTLLEPNSNVPTEEQLFDEANKKVENTPPPADTQVEDLPEPEYDGTIPVEAINSGVAVDVPVTDTQGTLDAKLTGMNQAIKEENQARIDAAETDIALREGNIMQDPEEAARAGISLYQEIVNEQVDPQVRRDIAQLDKLIAEDTREQQLLNEAITEGRGVQQSIARGQRAREKAILGINIATNTAIKQAKQGQIDDAKELASMGIQLYNNAKTENLKNERTFLNRAYDSLDTAEKAKADQRLKEIEKVENDLAQIESVYVNAVLNGASQNVLNAIRTSETGSDAVKVAGRLAMSPAEKLDLALKSEQLDKIQFENEQLRKATEQAENGEYVVTGDEDATVGGFALRMTDAEKVVREFEDKILLAGGDIPSFEDAVAFRAEGKLPTEFQSQEYKQYFQAQENFISAILREESGAAISDEEYVREASKYFPRPADGKDVLEQKRRSREVATASLVSSSKGGYQMLVQEVGESQAPTFGEATPDQQTTNYFNQAKTYIDEQTTYGGLQF